MAIFKYTLPSGSEFVLDAPAGTTQVEADKIFYEQVASGTFVGYRVGDSLTHPQEALTNFGLTRLERGTAGVDDKTMLAVIQNLPVVGTVPTLTSVPVATPVNQADFITVKSGLGPLPIGSLSSAQVQALLAQIAALVNQAYYLLTQEKGLGMFGLNALQLERAGYLKPGTVDRYLGGPANNTFSNPDNFVATLQTPSVWTGLDGITSVDILLADPDKQNMIQQKLMQQAYAALVANGTIKPAVTSATQPSTEVGQVYSSSQTLISNDAIAILGAGFGYIGYNTLYGNFSNSFNTTETTLASQIPDGDTTTLASGALSLVTKSDSTINAYNAVTTAVNSDIGALVTTGSKMGATVTTLWAKGTSALNNPGALTDKLVSGVTSTSTAIVTGAKAQAEALVAQGKQTIDNLGKAAKNAVSFADTKLTSLVAGVKKAGAFNNTVDRSTVDTAVTRVIGSEKIPSPSYELPNLQSLGISKDISQAQQILKTAQNTGTAIVNQAQSQASSISRLFG